MRKQKHCYDVYLDGRLVSSTYAASERQAINNVRHIKDGDIPTNQRYEAVLCDIPIVKPQLPLFNVIINNVPKQLTIFECMKVSTNEN